MARQAPDRKLVIAVLVIGLLIVAAFSLTLGGGGLFRVVRLLVVYGAAFLLLMYVLRTLRRRG